MKRPANRQKGSLKFPLAPCPPLKGVAGASIIIDRWPHSVKAIIVRRLTRRFLH
jgi:hypothetical protein